MVKQARSASLAYTNPDTLRWPSRGGAKNLKLEATRGGKGQSTGGNN